MTEKLTTLMELKHYATKAAVKELYEQGPGDVEFKMQLGREALRVGQEIRLELEGEFYFFRITSRTEDLENEIVEYKAVRCNDKVMEWSND